MCCGKCPCSSVSSVGECHNNYDIDDYSEFHYDYEELEDEESDLLNGTATTDASSLDSGIKLFTGSDGHAGRGENIEDIIN